MDRANDQGGNGHFVKKVFLPYCVYARESKRTWTHGLFRKVWLYLLSNV